MWSFTTNKFRKLKRLRPSEWRFLLTAYLYLIAAGWQIHVRKVRLDSWAAESSNDSSGTQKALDISQLSKNASRYLDLESRYPFQWAKCLQRSLAMCLWMNAHGIRPIIRFGVRPDGRSLEAHAWVEYQGTIINDSVLVEKEFALLTAVSESKLHTPFEEEVP